MSRKVTLPATVDTATTILICGKGRIATSALSHALHHVWAAGLSCRVLASPNADDKGYDTWQQSLRRAAALLDVQVVPLADVQQEPGLVLVSLEYDRLVRVERFASSRLYNIHFSALPKYRGVYTSIFPLLHGERQSGVTLHYMDPGVDTGAVIAQRTFDLPSWLTARMLYELYTDEGLALFREWLPRLLVAKPEGRAQDETGASTFPRRSLDLSLRELDFSLGAHRLSTFVRAYSFAEYQLPTVKGRAVRGCAVLNVSTDQAPGTELHRTGFSSSFAVAGGEVVEVIWA